MSGVRKIAEATVKNRTQTPFWNWLRNKLLAVDRLPITPPPGLPTADGKAVYHNPLRFPKTQSARPGSAEPPSIPGGVHHLLAENYYYTRDGRRQVLPPYPLYRSDANNVEYGTFTGEKIAEKDAVQVNKGPSSNFGLNAPTPGFGYEWKRTRADELETPRNDPELARLERFDRFAAIVTKMRISAASMGKHFGMLGKMYGEHRFAISPNEQKAFKGFINDAFVKVFKTYVWYQWYYYVPQVVTAYLIYDWAKKANYKASRKDPALYANDK